MDALAAARARGRTRGQKPKLGPPSHARAGAQTYPGYFPLVAAGNPVR